jgi:hypothetical protein
MLPLSPVFQVLDFRNRDEVRRTEPVVVVIIRTVVVPVTSKDPSIRSIVPIAADVRELNMLSTYPIRSFKTANPSADHSSQFVYEH